MSGFSCDANFCPRCGTLLSLPDHMDVIRCPHPHCSYEMSAKVLDGVEEYTCKTYDTSRPKEVDKSDELEGPLIDRKCLNCGHNGMVYHTMQTRSADEGQTVYYGCPKCKFQETENS
ncbi:DNA-directed RNA polymerase I subunit RPA12-like [Oscarella lobularis]|uniref:DNA-directed RNA polymerase I subunit RPA12-like n=1 Tax=Oscarella lobularis TaxID=121494 RepID=UPI0033130D20